KSFNLQKNNQYVFIVDSRTNKPAVRNAVKDRYGVRVLTVNMVSRKGKVKRLGRAVGKRSDFKKAIVTIAPGQKIEIT
ncbi:MAG: 50S ribosomal protein L23, partial [Patescibacteria group bacterium]